MRRRYAMTGCRQWLLCAATLIVPGMLRADTIVLRSGIRYADVKVQPVGESHRVFFEDGRVHLISNSDIRSVRRGPTTWTTVRSVDVPKPQEIVPAPEPVKPPPVREPAPLLSPLLKSIVAPGWGQYAQGRPLAAALYSSLTLLTFQRYWTYRQQHAAAERDYNDPMPVGLVAAQSTTGVLTVGQASLMNIAYLGQKERKVYAIQRQGNNMFLLLSAVWVWNILDIGRGGVPWERDWSRVRNPGVPDFAIYFRRDSIEFGARFGL